MQAEQLSGLDGEELNAAFLIANPAYRSEIDQDRRVVGREGKSEREVIVGRQMAGMLYPAAVDGQVQQHSFSCGAGGGRKRNLVMNFLLHCRSTI